MGRTSVRKTTVVKLLHHLLAVDEIDALHSLADTAAGEVVDGLGMLRIGRQDALDTIHGQVLGGIDINVEDMDATTLERHAEEFTLRHLIERRPAGVGVVTTTGTLVDENVLTPLCGLA